MEQKQPLVSVIIPNYNHARYLERRLDTVFGQTYPNFEVIILDDCSTDNSIEVINRYKDNPHLSQIVVNETNSGSVFKQWDKGINLAKGELIWIAESDDYCELNLLEELVRAMVAKDCALSFSSYVLFDDDGGRYVPTMHGTQYYSGKSFVSRWMTQENVVKNASGTIFKKEAVSLLSDEYMHFRQCGDYMFWVMIAEQGNVAFVNKNLTYWRIGNTYTSSNISSGLFAFEDKKVYDYISKKYYLPWLSRQIVLANRYLNYKGNKYEDDFVLNAIFKTWGIKHRNEKLDQLLCQLFNKVRIHLGILL